MASAIEKARRSVERAARLISVDEVANRPMSAETGMELVKAMREVLDVLESADLDVED